MDRGERQAKDSRTSEKARRPNLLHQWRGTFIVENERSTVAEVIGIVK